MLCNPVPFIRDHPLAIDPRSEGFLPAESDELRLVGLAGRVRLHSAPHTVAGAAETSALSVTVADQGAHISTVSPAMTGSPSS